ncbi:MAG: IS630 family transposase [Bacillota bacterium]
MVPFERKRPALVLSEEMAAQLERISRSRTTAVRRVERARMLLAYAAGETISSIAARLGTNRPKVERCIDKALQLGPEAALGDLPGRGRRPRIPAEARAWVVSLACQTPEDLGYPHELWTTRLLVRHIRRHCEAAGHPSLVRIGTGTLSRVLAEHAIRPYKIRYDLERRDPDFDAKMAQLLLVYKQVELLRQRQDPSGPLHAVLCYDEKPGIQVLGTTAPDRPPQPGQQGSWSRDYEVVRHGTLTLMAAIDLLTGHVHSQVVNRHRSREFVPFLKRLDASYPGGIPIRILLDHHSAHLSKETRSYLATVPNRFEFIFTPKHGSWLNLIEAFLAKMAKSLLRGIRAHSQEEMARRIAQYIDDLNQEPVVFRWKHGLETLSVT